MGLLDDITYKEQTMYQGNDFLHDIEQIYGCTDCDLNINRTNICIYRGWPEKADVMVVGEAPGRQEDEQAIPMVGRSGSFLIRILAENNFPTSRLYITNTVLCRPPDNRDPYEKEVRACADWFKLQFKLIQPKVILSVGAVPTKYLVPEIKGKGVTKVAGTLHQPAWLNMTPVIPILHPAYILRNPNRQDDYKRSVGLICHKIDEFLDSGDIEKLK